VSCMMAQDNDCVAHLRVRRFPSIFVSFPGPAVLDTRLTPL
jgi:hypothetical protein